MNGTSYAVKEGDFVITGKYSSRVLIPLTGNRYTEVLVQVNCVNNVIAIVKLLSNLHRLN